MSFDRLFKAFDWSTTHAPGDIDTARKLTGAARARQEATASQDRAPSIVRSVEQALEARGCPPCIYRVPYTADLIITPDELRSGQLDSTLYVQANVSSEWNIEKWLVAHESGNLHAYALSARIVGVNAQECDVDTLWTIQLTRDASAEPAQHRSTTASASGEPVCRVDREQPYTCTAGEVWPTRNDPAQPVEMLNDPVECNEPSIGVKFTSLDAVGFSSEALLKNVARRTRDQRAFIISLDYLYAGLLRRVHAAHTLSMLRSEYRSSLELELEPPSSYVLPRTKTHMRMTGAQLDDAVRFIERRLVPANNAYDVGRVCFSVRTFDDSGWLEAWQAACARVDSSHATERVANRNTASSNSLSAPSKSGVKIRVTFEIYMVALSGNRFVSTSNDKLHTKSIGHAAQSSSRVDTSLASRARVASASSQTLRNVIDASLADSTESPSATPRFYASNSKTNNTSSSSDDDDGEDEQNEPYEYPHRSVIEQARTARDTRTIQDDDSTTLVDDSETTDAISRAAESESAGHRVREDAAHRSLKST